MVTLMIAPLGVMLNRIRSTDYLDAYPGHLALSQYLWLFKLECNLQIGPIHLDLFHVVNFPDKIRKLMVQSKLMYVELYVYTPHWLGY